MKTIAILTVLLLLSVLLAGCTQQPANPSGGTPNSGGTQGNTAPAFSDADLTSFDSLLGDAEQDATGLSETEEPPQAFPA